MHETDKYDSETDKYDPKADKYDSEVDKYDPEVDKYDPEVDKYDSLPWSVEPLRPLAWSPHLTSGESNANI